MKHFSAAIVCLMLVSCLYGEQSGKVKAGAILGFTNGATIGLKVNNKPNTNREQYVNAAYCQNSDLLLVGINHEFRFNHTKNFYTLVIAGVDYYRVAGLLGDPGGGNSEDKDRFSSGLFPHISGGVGYKTAVGKNMHLFIELDVGIKASIGNINVGFIL
jgi:hypothetical protein